MLKKKSHFYGLQGVPKGSGRFPTRKAVSQIGVLLEKLRHEIWPNSENSDSGNNITPLIQQKIETTAENGLNTVTIIKNTNTNQQKRKKFIAVKEYV